MNRTWAFWLAAAAVGGLVARPAFGIYEDVTTERYPDADAVLVDSVATVAYQADGSYVSDDEHQIKILTEKGRVSESEIEIAFNRRYGTAAITGVSVVGADGAERAVDVSATTKETTDNASASENIFDPQARKIVCTVPGLKVGDVLKYTTHRENLRSRVENQFADIGVLEWSVPIVRSVVTFIAPKERPLVNRTVRHPLGNVDYREETLSDGRLSYTWTARNSPQAFAEPNTPPFYTQVQHVRVSTAKDWPTLSKWYWELCVPHLGKTTAGITNKVEEILATTEAAELPRIEALFKWVSQEIRYMGLTMEDTSPGYAPHDVAITFDNRYGVCRDKAALLVAMLRIAGIEAYPVLIHAGAKMDDEVPQPYFNHAIVAVRAPESLAANADGFILMDPTNESSRDLMPAYLSDRSYLVATPYGEGLHVSQVPTAEANKVAIASEGTLAKDGSVLLQSTVEFLGYNDTIYRGVFLRQKPDDRRQMFERLMRNAAAGAELLDLTIEPDDLQDTTRPLVARFLVKMPETLVRGETRDEFVAPLLSRQFGAANWLLNGATSLEKRRYPLDIDSTAKVEETLTVNLGESVGDVVSLPDDIAIEGSYAFTRTYRVADGVFTARRCLAINSVEISADDYLNVRESIKRVEASERKRPVFAKDALANANVRYLGSREAITLKDAYNWTVERTVSKEILTYDGKKSESELTFHYNPTWQDVKLVSATVANKDGKVATVGEKEINLFDCEWASSAPRYPASKKLVVNLPSVEVGSVITYTVRTTVTDAPSAFYALRYFDSVEPVDRLTLTIDGAGEHLVFDGRPARIKAEPMQPAGVLWREHAIVSKGDFARTAARLKRAADVAPLAGAVEATTLEEIRNWMAKHVRLTGPSLYEVPLAAQLTDPRTVLKERYATRLDYVRTLCALLRGAGYDADVVFATLDADDDAALKRLDMVEKPNEAAFAAALCRVTVRDGGFLWWGGAETTYFIGTENEYAPLGATIYDGSHYLDPATGAFGVVTKSAADLAAASTVEMTVTVRENGAADVDMLETQFGPGVGTFRKDYAELLAEERSRHFQTLLGNLAQAATATRELETDVTGYPARLSFSAYIPDFATVSGDAITLTVPAFYRPLFSLTGAVRTTPLLAGATEKSVTKVTVVFPEGYTLAEHLPEAHALVNPLKPGERWLTFAVERAVQDGRLTVTLTRTVDKHPDARLAKGYFALLKDWTREAMSRANRTITVRRR